MAPASASPRLSAVGTVVTTRFDFESVYKVRASTPMTSEPRVLHPVFRCLAGLLAVLSFVAALVFAYLGLTGSSQSWLWVALLEGAMSYVFGYAALRGRGPV